MDLRFPELGGGPVQGLNDAGVENFQGAIDSYLSRECGQNTGDAVRRGVKTARLEFDRIDMPSADIPGFDSLRRTLSACYDRWGSKKKEKEFFEAARALSAQAMIPVLKISDYGTTGLTGDDTDEAGKWFALVKSQGVSNKDETAGGSFGIGKSSPFAASRFRTVFYGTRTETQSVALQGVCRLVTHKSQSGSQTQGIGFVGSYDDAVSGEPVFRAIRDEAAIPTRFHRTEVGTDIWIVGYRSGLSWENDLVRSILTNFWPAIFRNAIEFRVGSQEITARSLGTFIQQYRGQEDFDVDQYFTAITNVPATRRLQTVGACELFLTTAGKDLPKRICMARASGMRIFDYAPRACRVPFSGLFICTDAQGNGLLRSLEPPKHDTWDPKRVEGSAGKNAMQEIKDWIREEVKKLNPMLTGNSFNESELAKYLPDAVPDDATSVPSPPSTSAQTETLEPKASEDDQVAQFARVVPVVAAKTVLTGKTGEGETKESAPRKRPGGKSTDGDKNYAEGDSPAPPVLATRSFRTGLDTYRLVLRSGAEYRGRVIVRAVGEDGAVLPVSIIDAKDETGEALTVGTDRSSIDNLKVLLNLPRRIHLTLSALERRALSAAFET